MEDIKRTKSNFWDENYKGWDLKNNNKLDVINSRLSITEEKVNEHANRNHSKWNTEEERINFKN